MSDGNAQERHYDAAVDYRLGSPHLTHSQLYRRLVSLLLKTLDAATSNGLRRTVLEAGAGHGGFTEPVLASGADVLAVEMSAFSVAELERKFQSTGSFRAIHSPDGSLDAVEGFYTLAMAVSVLHHVRDYVSFVRDLAQHVSPGGSLITLQDPMWYPRHKVAHRVDTLGFLTWRIAQGNLRRGFATRLGRLQRGLDESSPGDTVEYHVVRNGCDEALIARELARIFARVEVIPYWSNQLGLGQRVGEWLGLKNTFAVVASGRR